MPRRQASSKKRIGHLVDIVLLLLDYVDNVLQYGWIMLIMDYSVSGLRYWRITAVAESRALERVLMAEKEELLLIL